MTQSIDEEYAKRLKGAYLGEIYGFWLFDGMSRVEHDEDRSHKWEWLARLEAETRDRLKPLVERYQLVTGDEKRAARERGIVTIEEFARRGWDKVMSNYAEMDLSPYYTLEELAPAEDKEVLKFMTHHEIALKEFAHRELHGEENSLELVENLLGE